MTTTTDRIAAGRAVGRVIRDGGWSNVVTRTEASKLGADVAAVQGIVLEVLRHLPALDRAIEDAASRSIAEIDPSVLDLLRVALGEIVGQRTPVPLVVDGTVHAVREVSPRAAGFANAVLRRVSLDRPVMSTIADIGIPLFADEALRHVLESEEVDALWRASQEPAAVGLRSRAPVAGASPVPGVASAWLWSEGTPPEGVPVQDPASVAVGETVASAPGQLVLDTAAAPGGKTAHLVEDVAPHGQVIATDRSRRRVRDAVRRVPSASWLVADGTALPFAESTFDRVLVDAPCSGLGTLRRRPEIRYRVTPEEVNRLAMVQRRMLVEALRVARPGGRVVYSVCTVLPQETIDVVSGLGGRPPEALPGTPFGDGWLMAPHLGPTDGMFVCVFDV